MQIVVPMLEARPYSTGFIEQAGPRRQLGRVNSFERTMTAQPAGDGSFGAQFERELLPFQEDAAAIRVDMLSAAPARELSFEVTVDAYIEQSIPGGYEALHSASESLDEAISDVTMARLLEATRDAGFPYVQIDMSIDSSTLYAPPGSPPSSPTPAPLAPPPLGYIDMQLLMWLMIIIGVSSIVLFAICYLGFDRYLRAWFARRAERLALWKAKRARAQAELASKRLRAAEAFMPDATPCGRLRAEGRSELLSRASRRNEWLVDEAMEVDETTPLQSPASVRSSHAVTSTREGSSFPSDRQTRPEPPAHVGALPPPLPIAYSVTQRVESPLVSSMVAKGPRRRPEGRAAAEARLDGWFRHTFTARRPSAHVDKLIAARPSKRRRELGSTLATRSSGVMQLPLSEVHDPALLDIAATRSKAHLSAAQKLGSPGGSSSSSEDPPEALPVKAAPGRLARIRSPAFISRRRTVGTTGVASAAAKQMAAWEMSHTEDRLEQRLRVMRWLLGAMGETDAQAVAEQLEQHNILSVDELQERWSHVSKDLAPAARELLAERLKLGAWFRGAGVSIDEVDGALALLASVGVLSVAQLREAWRKGVVPLQVRLRWRALVELIDEALHNDERVGAETDSQQLEAAEEAEVDSPVAEADDSQVAVEVDSQPPVDSPAAEAEMPLAVLEPPAQVDSPEYVEEYVEPLPVPRSEMSLEGLQSEQLLALADAACQTSLRDTEAHELAAASSARGLLSARAYVAAHDAAVQAETPRELSSRAPSTLMGLADETYTPRVDAEEVMESDAGGESGMLPEQGEDEREPAATAPPEVVAVLQALAMRQLDAIELAIEHAARAGIHQSVLNDLTDATVERLQIEKAAEEALSAALAGNDDDTEALRSALAKASAARLAVPMVESAALRLRRLEEALAERRAAALAHEAAVAAHQRREVEDAASTILQAAARGVAVRRGLRFAALEARRVAEESILAALRARQEPELRAALATGLDAGVSTSVLAAATEALARLKVEVIERTRCEEALRHALVLEDVPAMRASLAEAVAVGADAALTAVARGAISRLEKLELARCEAESALRASLEAVSACVDGDEAAADAASSALAASLLRARALAVDTPLMEPAGEKMRQLLEEKALAAEARRVLEAAAAEEEQARLDAEAAELRERKAARHEEAQAAHDEAEQRVAQLRSDMRFAVSVGATREARGRAGGGLLQQIRRKHASANSALGGGTSSRGDTEGALARPPPPAPLASPPTTASAVSARGEQHRPIVRL